MKEFNNYLVSKHFTTKNESHFYKLWAKNLYDFIGQIPDSEVKNEEIDKYINYISRIKSDWQARQAQEAIRIYFHFKNQSVEPNLNADQKLLRRCD